MGVGVTASFPRVLSSHVDSLPCQLNVHYTTSGVLVTHVLAGHRGTAFTQSRSCGQSPHLGV